MNQEKIGKFILQLRKKNNLTQNNFAKKLNVTAQAVSKWENGRGIPDIEIIRKISKEFNVDIESILNGEEKKKNRNKKVMLIPISLILIIFLIIGFVIFSHTDFEFSNLKSTNEEFNIKGVAAYSKDKKSIYISEIEYLNDKRTNEKYTVAECILYERNKKRDNKISQCGEIDTSKKYDYKEAKSLSELLKDIEFSIDDYNSTCKNLKASSLYININVLDTNKKIITYKIPLELSGKCN